jgi:O-antigen/teichoic acid export membrane protein
MENHSAQRRRELVGALIAIGAIISLFAGAFLFGLSFFTQLLFKSDIGPALRFFSVLFGLTGLQGLVEAICRGENRIGALSLFRIGAKTMNVVLILLFIVVKRYSFMVSLAVNLVSILAAVAILLATAKPLFSNVKASFRMIVADVRVYGWNAYIGNLSSTASAKTDSMLISAFVDTTSVGFYNLASLLTFPMTTFSRSLSTTMFKRFASQDRIPRAVIFVNLVWLVGSGIVLLLLRKFFVHLLFGKGYDPVIGLILPLVLSSILGGLAQPFNMFMGAKGMGAYLRNTALVMTGLNLPLNILFIHHWGAIGACYASVIALAVNFGVHLFYYRRTLSKILQSKAAEVAARVTNP